MLEVLAVLVSAGWAAAAAAARPHIVIILADDMGWNDVGFHGSAQVPTPNMDALAYSGVVLHAHYAPPLCTPARAALLTGKYPIHTGLQHSVLLAPEPRGLELDLKLLPQLLRERGYSTRMVGKWHLGFHRAAYTPTRRGFDSHYGYWNGFQDYYEHTVEATFNSSMYGTDMRRNLTLSTEDRGRYATHLYTEEAVATIRAHGEGPLFLYLAHLAPHSGTRRRPMQPPPKPDALTEGISDANRRDYAAMTAELDRGVGEVMQALQEKNMLRDTVLLLLSDNGAPTRPQIHGNYGSNYPLRGEKNTPWEGGSRTVAVLWSASLPQTPRLHKHLLHIADWLPTLYSAAGGDPKNLKDIDGIDAWAAIHKGVQSRSELLINIDQAPNATEPVYWAMRRQQWKVVWVKEKRPGDAWLGDSGEGFVYNWDRTLNSSTANALKNIGLEVNRTQAERIREAATVKCPVPRHNPPDCVKSPCLFNLDSDPCETLDISSLRTHIVDSLNDRMQEWMKSSVPAKNRANDPSADPALHGGAWVCWGDETAQITEHIGNLFKKENQEKDHWEYVGLGAGCVILFMLVLGTYAGWKKVDEGGKCCGVRRKSRERRNGSLVARNVELFEQLASDSGEVSNGVRNVRIIST